MNSVLDGALLASAKVDARPSVEQGTNDCFRILYYKQAWKKTMNEKIWDTTASKVMSRVVVTVSDRDRIEKAAELMAEHKINAVPVVHESGSCVGILTSQNIVEYEAIRKDIENEFKHGYFFDLARYGVEKAPAIARIRFDEIDHHMDRNVVFASPNDPLGELAEKMCSNHSHHAVILDTKAKVCGIVSSLDILAAGVSTGISS